LVQDLENQGVPLLVLVLAPEVATPAVRTKIHFLQLDSLSQQLSQL